MGKNAESYICMSFFVCFCLTDWFVSAVILRLRKHLNWLVLGCSNALIVHNVDLGHIVCSNRRIDTRFRTAVTGPIQCSGGESVLIWNLKQFVTSIYVCLWKFQSPASNLKEDVAWKRTWLNIMLDINKFW